MAAAFMAVSSHLTIIGAGIAGLLTAWRWAAAGQPVTVYDAAPSLTTSASALALGLLVPSGLNRPIDALQRTGCAQWAMLAPQLATITGTPIEDFYRPWPPHHAQLRVPHTLVLLAQAVQILGGSIHFNHPLSTLPSTSATHPVLLAAGWGNTQLAGMPQTVARGQALRVQSLSPIPPALHTADNLFLVPDWDATWLIGSHNTTQPAPTEASHHPNPAHTAQLLARAARIVPALEGATVMDVWVGHRPISNPRLPLIRPVAPHTWAVAGLGKTGYALAPLVAESVFNTLQS
jgi:glycine/D-amino acid oxidase-like deaminating enzyme